MAARGQGGRGTWARPTLPHVLSLAPPSGTRTLEGVLFSQVPLPSLRVCTCLFPGCTIVGCPISLRGGQGPAGYRQSLGRGEEGQGQGQGCCQWRLGVGAPRRQKFLGLGRKRSGETLWPPCWVHFIGTCMVGMGVGEQ